MDYHKRFFTVIVISTSFILLSCNNTSSSSKKKLLPPRLEVIEPIVTKKSFTKDYPLKKKKIVVTAIDTIKADTAKTYVYLTFDDGPQPGTLNCFEILKQNNVKGTFFLVAEHALQSKLSKSIVDSLRTQDNCLIANHSFSHAHHNRYDNFYTHPDFVENDFKLAQDCLRIPYKIVRLPGNNSWATNGIVRSTKLTKKATHLLDSAGYSVVGWDLEWEFASKTGKPIQSADSMVRLVKRAVEKRSAYTQNHLVILTHDRMFKEQSEADSLVKFIAELKKDKRYIFQTVDNYPKLKLQQKNLSL